MKVETYIVVSIAVSPIVAAGWWFSPGTKERGYEIILSSGNYDTIAGQVCNAILLLAICMN
jgi:hypothetical protein